MTPELVNLLIEAEKNRPKTSIDTGSLLLEDAIILHNLVLQYPIKRAVEWGTYIGRSAIAIATAMEAGVVYTCDGKNDAFDGGYYGAEIVVFPYTSSTTMMKTLQPPIDLFFFDGFILKDDVDEIKRLSHLGTLYVFDDFKAKMKGTLNVPMMAHLKDTHQFKTEGNALAMYLP